jgi:hypothetical protein
VLGSQSDVGEEQFVLAGEEEGFSRLFAQREFSLNPDDVEGDSEPVDLTLAVLAESVVDEGLL